MRPSTTAFPSTEMEGLEVEVVDGVAEMEAARAVTGRRASAAHAMGIPNPGSLRRVQWAGRRSLFGTQDLDMAQPSSARRAPSTAGSAGRAPRKVS
ncbi:MAG: hypothetical protein A2V77_09565 [Anaeromyxobacter sp. RBG_16_69_14]|nr:MAG: hypothetical protein A2V77_09565 [Anaeromyxobacter sp. RBG_16_69_14]